MVAWDPDGLVNVLMPCRALEAFRRSVWSGRGHRPFSLNALSGIGGVQTRPLQLAVPDPGQS